MPRDTPGTVPAPPHGRRRAQGPKSSVIPPRHRRKSTACAPPDSSAPLPPKTPAGVLLQGCRRPHARLGGPPLGPPHGSTRHRDTPSPNAIQTGFGGMLTRFGHPLYLPFSGVPEADCDRRTLGVVAQLVRASDCRSEGCGFEPRRPRPKGRFLIAPAGLPGWRLSCAVAR